MTVRCFAYDYSTITGTKASGAEISGYSGALEVNVVDFMNNSPNWQGSENSVRNVFWPNIHKLLMGKTTPKECAADLNRDCNAAIHVKTSFHE